MPRTADEWIDALHLVPHPEGGCFRETYRSRDVVAADALPPRFGGPRPVSTAIYFLLKGSQYSALHRLRADEVWHHYAGSPLTISQLHASGTLIEVRLGTADDGRSLPQVVVPAGCWFGAVVDDADSYALLGCTVAPGYCEEDFELGDRAALMASFPQHAGLIARLTRRA